MPFSRYMQLCLYDPAHGYYAANAEQFGKAGDFYTSSDVHALFGRLLARQFEEIWQAFGHPSQFEVLELGPGRGLFARDVLDWCKKKLPDFFGVLTYTLQESSPTLRAKVEESLQEHLATGKARISIGEPDRLGRALNLDTPIIVFCQRILRRTAGGGSERRGQLTLRSKTVICRKCGCLRARKNWNFSIATAFIPKARNESK